MSNIRENIERIKKELAAFGRNTELVAVTKNFPVDDINEAISAGITQIGENRVQELLSKYDGIKEREKIKINLIGHLQTNKVKYIIGKVDLIQSLDSARLAEKIDELSKKAGIVTDVLVQLNMGSEENKFGIEPDKCEEFLNEIASYANIHVKGLMGVVPKTDDNAVTEKYFLQLYNIFLDIRAKNIDNIDMEVLSMGMSSDYIIAAKCGSNMVRVGTAIFGNRKYNKDINTEELK